jgi:hypothetical protein
MAAILDTTAPRPNYDLVAIPARRGGVAPAAFAADRVTSLPQSMAIKPPVPLGFSA